jgi:hypothetical protein
MPAMIETSHKNSFCSQNQRSLLSASRFHCFTEPTINLVSATCVVKAKEYQANLTQTAIELFPNN